MHQYQPERFGKYCHIGHWQTPEILHPYQIFLSYLVQDYQIHCKQLNKKINCLIQEALPLNPKRYLQHYDTCLAKKKQTQKTGKAHFEVFNINLPKLLLNQYTDHMHTCLQNHSGRSIALPAKSNDEAVHDHRKKLVK